MLKIWWRVYIIQVRFASICTFPNLKGENASSINECSVSKLTASMFLSKFVLNFSAA